jgi:hypothetical protein
VAGKVTMVRLGREEKSDNFLDLIEISELSLLRALKYLRVLKNSMLKGKSVKRKKINVNEIVAKRLQKIKPR